MIDDMQAGDQFGWSRTGCSGIVLVLCSLSEISPAQVSSQHSGSGRV